MYARVCVHARVRTRVLTCTLYHRWLRGALPVHSEDHDRSATVKTPSQRTKRAAPFVHLPSSSHPELLSVLGLFSSSFSLLFSSSFLRSARTESGRREAKGKPSGSKPRLWTSLKSCHKCTVRRHAREQLADNQGRWGFARERARVA